jgi:hypothetical protein|tara:strand:- start:626 stop:943 length:318 start_codon:yes stop_codon:yes gene_type:complete
MIKKKFRPMCMEGNPLTEMAVTNRNQLLPCCYIDSPIHLEEFTLKKLAQASDLSKHSIDEILKSKEWVALNRSLQEAIESGDTSKVNNSCVNICSMEQRREEWQK